MGIIDDVIDGFEKRVFALEEIRCITALPQWTDIDVIQAKCLIQQYRNLTSQSSGPDKAEAQLQTFNGVTSEATNVGNQQSGG